jgi:hypothetical protein
VVSEAVRWPVVRAVAVVVLAEGGNDGEGSVTGQQGSKSPPPPEALTLWGATVVACTHRPQMPPPHLAGWGDPLASYAMIADRRIHRCNVRSNRCGHHSGGTSPHPILT